MVSGRCAPSHTLYSTAPRAPWLQPQRRLYTATAAKSDFATVVQLSHQHLHSAHRFCPDTLAAGAAPAAAAPSTAAPSAAGAPAAAGGGGGGVMPASHSASAVARCIVDSPWSMTVQQLASRPAYHCYERCDLHSIRGKISVGHAKGPCFALACAFTTHFPHAARLPRLSNSMRRYVAHFAQNICEKEENWCSTLSGGN